MAGIQTSNITTASGDLEINPGGTGQTQIKSVTANNPGSTPLASETDGTVKKLVITDLTDIGDPEDEDWLMIHDSSTGQTKKVSASKLGGTTPQAPIGAIPGQGTWTDKDDTLAVKAGGDAPSAGGMNNAVHFNVAAGPYNQSDKAITEGQDFAVKWDQAKFDSLAHLDKISGTLYAKDGKSAYTEDFNFQAELHPTAGWDIVDLADQPISTEVTSAPTIPTGMNAPSPVTIDGGTLTSIQVSVNGAAFTATPPRILSGQNIRVKGTTGATYSTGYTALVSIGGLQKTWTVTTEVDPGSITQPILTAPIDAATELDLSAGVQLVSSPFATTRPTGSFNATTWEVYQADADLPKPAAGATPGIDWTQVFSQSAGAVTSYDYNTGLPVDKYYIGRVKHIDSDGEESLWSNWNKWDTVASDKTWVSGFDGGSDIVHINYSPNSKTFCAVYNGYGKVMGSYFLFDAEGATQAPRSTYGGSLEGSMRFVAPARKGSSVCWVSCGTNKASYTRGSTFDCVNPTSASAAGGVSWDVALGNYISGTNFSIVAPADGQVASFGTDKGRGGCDRVMSSYALMRPCPQESPNTDTGRGEGGSPDPCFVKSHFGGGSARATSGYTMFHSSGLSTMSVTNRKGTATDITGQLPTACAYINGNHSNLICALGINKRWYLATAADHPYDVMDASIWVDKGEVTGLVNPKVCALAGTTFVAIGTDSSGVSCIFWSVDDGATWSKQAEPSIGDAKHAALSNKILAVVRSSGTLIAFDFITP